MFILQSVARWCYCTHHRIRNTDEVDAFYKDIDKPSLLQSKLNTMGFQWKGELSYFDWNKTPAESLASLTRQINCGDYMMFYVELYQRLGIQYDCYLLEKGCPWLWNYDWHYVSTFTWQEQIWIQSNNDIQRLKGDIISNFPQYKRIRVFDSQLFPNL